MGGWVLTYRKDSFTHLLIEWVCTVRTFVGGPAHGAEIDARGHTIDGATLHLVGGWVGGWKGRWVGGWAGGWKRWVVGGLPGRPLPGRRWCGRRG